MPIHTAKQISTPTLNELDRALCRLRRNPIDGPMIERFGYDHGNTLIYDTSGKCDLLIDNSDEIRRDCARLFQFCSPAMMRELWRGYKLAKAAGLIAGPLQSSTETAQPAKPAAEPLFYAKDMVVYQRPVQKGTSVTMGFAVCEVRDGVDPLELCAMLNKAEPPQ
jgi:hypothetical protein